ncbi:hypothetical protein [Nitrosomonas sp.]|nr:hypothetical protein [Nitrosomonas sp.]
MTHSSDVIINGQLPAQNSRGEQTCVSLVIATGGLSIPKIGTPL